MTTKNCKRERKHPKRKERMMKQLTVLHSTVVMENPESLHNYFAWPTVATLADGRLAVSASGFRTDHLCPFGKAVLAVSENGGKSFSPPAAVIATVLDDRDAGIAVQGSRAVFTSFNNTLAFQREKADRVPGTRAAYFHAYLDHAGKDPEGERAALSSSFRLSHDGGVTWSKTRYPSPVSAPHGAFFTEDGRLLYIGCRFDTWDAVECHEIDPETGKMTLLGTVPPIEGGALPSYEPHGIARKDGSLLAIIRTEKQPVCKNWQNAYEIFTVYQSLSVDGGRTWSEPAPLCVVGDAPAPHMLGAPPHLMRDRRGRILLTAANRIQPFGIYVYVSEDEGATYQAYELPSHLPNTADFGYPATAESADGSYFTVWYQHQRENSPAVIAGSAWQFS